MHCDARVTHDKLRRRADNDDVDVDLFLHADARGRGRTLRDAFTFSARDLFARLLCRTCPDTQTRSVCVRHTHTRRKNAQHVRPVLSLSLYLSPRVPDSPEKHLLRKQPRSTQLIRLWASVGVNWFYRF